MTEQVAPSRDEVGEHLASSSVFDWAGLVGAYDKFNRAAAETGLFGSGREMVWRIQRELTNITRRFEDAFETLSQPETVQRELVRVCLIVGGVGRDVTRDPTVNANLVAGDVADVAYSITRGYPQRFGQIFSRLASLVAAFDGQQKSLNLPPRDRMALAAPEIVKAALTSLIKLDSTEYGGKALQAIREEDDQTLADIAQVTVYRSGSKLLRDLVAFRSAGQYGGFDTNSPLAKKTQSFKPAGEYGFYEVDGDRITQLYTVRAEGLIDKRNIATAIAGNQLWTIKNVVPDLLLDINQLLGINAVGIGRTLLMVDQAFGVKADSLMAKLAGQPGSDISSIPNKLRFATVGRVATENYRLLRYQVQVDSFEYF